MSVPAAYISQQAVFYQAMVAYLQNPANWPDGVPKITDFSPGSIATMFFNAVAVGHDQVNLQYFNDSQQNSVLTATGSSLDDIGANWGVTRKAAVAGTGSFNFTKNSASTTDWPILAGTIISTLPASDGSTVQYTTNANATLTAGQTSVTVAATCSNPGPGSGGNLTTNETLVLGSAVPGIDGVTLVANITNGVDAEDDDAYRARIQEAMQNPPGPGSPSDYEEWAMAVTGVASATALRLNRGPGTVDVLITATNGVAPSSTLISSVQEAINAKAPADADVEVIGPTIVTVNAVLNLTLASGYTLAGVQSAVQTAVQNYINGVASGGTVFNSHVVSAAIGVAGVLDCQATLSVGGTTYTNVVLTSSQAAQAGTITPQLAALGG